MRKTIGKCGWGFTEMCRNSTSDPRDDLVYGTKALSGICSLVADIHQSGANFERTSPAELSELLDIVRDRIQGAADKLEDYVPRLHPAAKM